MWTPTNFVDAETSKFYHMILEMPREPLVSWNILLINWLNRGNCMDVMRVILLSGYRIEIIWEINGYMSILTKLNALGAILNGQFVIRILGSTDTITNLGETIRIVLHIITIHNFVILSQHVLGACMTKNATIIMKTIMIMTIG